MATIPRVQKIRIRREGGFAGLTFTTESSDAALITTVREELAKIPVARGPRIPDSFQYIFEMHLGTGDASAISSRQLPERILTESLRALLRELTFTP